MEGILQFAVQSVEWTYSLFWRFSTQQRMLVWGDGFYNGPIKTTKTLHPAAAAQQQHQQHQHSASLSLHRTHQLTDLYNSLSASDTLRRPTSAALSPEDLTETEWFYLLCLSFSFPPGFGLPGKAYCKKKHVWITGANEIDSKIFSRAILAKTVVCIPLMDGVVELGSTDKVKEDMAFIQHIKSIFIETERRCEAQKPALSELSTSNSATSLDHFYYKHLFHSTNSSNRKESELEDEMDSDSSTSNSSNSNAAEGGGGGCPCWPSTVAGAVMASKPSELIMQLEPSEDIRLGSPDDASNNFFPNLSHSQSPPPELNTNFDYHLPSNTNATTQLQLPTLGYSSAAEAVMTEDQDTHYTNMLSAILNLNQNHQSSQWLNSSAVSNITCSTQSAFSKWTHHSDGLYCVKAGTASTSQCLLKSILHTIPFLHNKHHREQNLYKFCDGQSQNGISQDFLANPESLNDKFIILRSAVPFTTKMDKASILGDTVEYLEQLRQKVQDLEAQNLEFQSSRRISFQEVQRNSPVPRTCLDKRKLRILEGVGDGCTRPKMLKLPSPPTPLDTNLQVSIIGGDGLLELQCPYKEGLLLDILLILQGLQIETTAVRSSVSNGIFIAELRAKVKEDTDGKKASILEVKSAIQQIIPCVDT
ncbi:basic helix-loop-helix protein A isoform X2 [Cucumis melo var. makuwa]|uniref:Basic helix-loop-helix protein A isoform X2 n=1 Tax=Cucumis melo var. makuwa TaxID=1194695 RepID=A0A5A7UUX4_CUCMM|nr:basic helix-loop-helix protein A isoform X2 [Cucumis melo var. makuwa]